MVVITPKMNLLQIPIKDKFYVSPSDPASLTRDTEFAQEKGLLNPLQSLEARQGGDLQLLSPKLDAARPVAAFASPVSAHA